MAAPTFQEIQNAFAQALSPIDRLSSGRLTIALQNEQDRKTQARADQERAFTRQIRQEDFARQQEAHRQNLDDAQTAAERSALVSEAIRLKINPSKKSNSQLFDEIGAAKTEAATKQVRFLDAEIERNKKEAEKAFDRVKAEMLRNTDPASLRKAADSVLADPLLTDVLSDSQRATLQKSNLTDADVGKIFDEIRKDYWVFGGQEKQDAQAFATAFNTAKNASLDTGKQVSISTYLSTLKSLSDESSNIWRDRRAVVQANAPFLPPDLIYSPPTVDSSVGGTAPTVDQQGLVTPGALLGTPTDGTQTTPGTPNPTAQPVPGTPTTSVPPVGVMQVPGIISPVGEAAQPIVSGLGGVIRGTGSSVVTGLQNARSLLFGGPLQATDTSKFRPMGTDQSFGPSSAQVGQGVGFPSGGGVSPVPPVSSGAPPSTQNVDLESMMQNPQVKQRISEIFGTADATLIRRASQLLASEQGLSMDQVKQLGTAAGKGDLQAITMLRQYIQKANASAYGTMPPTFQAIPGFAPDPAFNPAYKPYGTLRPTP